MKNTEENLILYLQELATDLREKLEEQGGRGVELADRIDRLERAVASLRGELVCPQCGAQL